MLPESKFPVTGGIMQTEEVVPRAQSTGLDGSASDGAVSFQQPVRYTQQIQYSLPPFVNMAVKQEPQEEDERDRQPSTLSPQTEIEDIQSVPDGSLNHKRVAGQSSKEFQSLNMQLPQQNGCKKSANRGRRKSRWKLKFHHQALPPEYLDHYEAALAQEAAMNSSTACASNESRMTSPAPTAPMPTTTTFNPTQSPIADVQSWLQRLSAMQNDIYTGSPQQVAQHPQPQPQPQSRTPRRSVITSTLQSTQPVYNQPASQQQHHRNSQPNQPRPPMKYSDLPYMGEITLDNSKPRRGRKPKKADICHLIYKNYGTILPGTPGLEDKHARQQVPSSREKVEAPQVPIPFQRTDIQNRISSLLEKRLTQERRALALDSADCTKEQEEPLNLCLRDLNLLLKLRLNDKNSSSTFGSSNSKSDASSEPEDIDYLAQNHDQPDFESQTLESNSDVNVDPKPNEELENRLLLVNPTLAMNSQLPIGSSDEVESNGKINPDFLGNNHQNSNCSNGKPNIENDPNQGKNNHPGFLYWPNAGVFIHPVSLQSQFMYYQKLAQEKGLPGVPAPEQLVKEQRIVPKSLYSMLENSKIPSVPSPILPMSESSPPDTTRATRATSPRTKRNSTSQSSSAASNQPAMKRKRSAIFIPPMPTENNNNPATEVSICKFKFTGGAKPSLQEKKSLSVDSGGNFRYYSGTGDKSMRGYEFFPREALQQPASQAGSSSSGAFLNAAAERIPQAAPSASPRPCSIQDDSRRKRKTRKSIQREKLEQTFKEKGFLIQTQQLESAEGATYCKFRQLRKFTRYLFRSWKDYLPGNVRELTDSGEPIPGVLKDMEGEVIGEAMQQPDASPMTPVGLEHQQPVLIDTSSSPSLPLN